jgi:exodeoxyribonuclease VII small subunit
MNDFETRLERLEEIATKLRDGTVRIDAAAALFEEGMNLSRGLEKELRGMERRVEVLVNESMDEEEPPALELFGDDGGPASSGERR